MDHKLIFFKHKRGLRQGNPLSPMLFILVADTLSRFLKNAETQMHTPTFIHTKAIQFADDTVIIAEAHPTTLKVIARILRVYEELTGLKINRNKSSFVPMAIPVQLTGVVSEILDSTDSRLPIKYLGLPLTIRKPRKILFQPMLEALQRRIEGWTASLLTFGGRVTLVKAVLSAILLHFMQAMRMPKGVIRHIDRMQRKFLWKGMEICKGINCLVN